MAELTLVEAVNDALHTELARDDDVMVLGEDVGRAGGVFRATAGLRDRFGADRCVDTPLAEAGLLGGAVGLCMAGWRPVVEMQYDAFSYPSLNQLITHVGRYRWRTGGRMQFPLTIRMPYGGGVRAPELHDDSPEAYYVHTPGIKVAIPSTPADAKGLLAAAIRDPDPVVVLEPKLVYRTSRGEVPEGEHVVPLGEARIAREGSDVTLIAYGAMVPVCELAADAVDASCEIVDIRSLRPLDERTILASVAKTGRVVIVHEAPRTAGFGAELAALIAERAIFDLQGPVLRVTGYDVPYPYWTIEDAYMPSVERVVAADRLADVIHELPFERRTLHGHFSRDLEPVLTSTPATRCASRRRTPAGGSTTRRSSSRRRRPRTTGMRSRARSRSTARTVGQTLVVQIDEVVPRPMGRDVRRRRFGFDWDLADGRRHGPRPPRAPRAVPRRDGHAAGRRRRALDVAAAAAGREHRLQGARRRHDALPADPRRRSVVLRRRRPCGSRRRRGERDRDRVPFARAAHARRPRRPAARLAVCAHRRRVADVRVRRAI